MANKLASQGGKIFRGKGGRWLRGAGGVHGRETQAGFQVDECYCATHWAFIVNQSNTAAIAPALHDMALFQRQDVASIKIVDVGDSNALGLASGDGNSTISSVNTLRFYTGGCHLSNPYSGMGGGIALCIGSDKTAKFYCGLCVCGGNLETSGAVVVGGNLTVQGTTTTLDTTNLLVEDPLVVLSKNQSGTPTLDSGMLVERGSSNNVAFIWDESADEFAVTCTSDAGAGAGNINMGGYQNLKASTLCATSHVKVGDNASVCPFPVSTGTRGITVRGSCATSAGIELRGGNNTWHGTLYGAGSTYGFLDSSWGGWDIQKIANGDFSAWVGSGGFICACEGGIRAATNICAPVVCATSLWATTCVCSPRYGAANSYFCDECLAFGWGGGWFQTEATKLCLVGGKILHSAGVICSTTAVCTPMVCATNCIAIPVCKDLKIGNTRIHNYADTRLRICGSGDNSLELGPANDNGWMYFMSTNNSNGMYIYTNQGAFNFDDAHLRGYNDAEVDIGVSGGRFRCGHFSHTVTSYCLYATHCAMSPIVCGTSCVKAPTLCASSCIYVAGTSTFWPGSTTNRSLHICKWTTGWNGGTGEAVWGLEWAHVPGSARRAQLFYDHNGSEEFVMQSNYGDIVFNACQNGNLNPNAATERLRIGAVTGAVTAAGKLYACTCVQSPIVCGTSCVRADTLLATNDVYVCDDLFVNYIRGAHNTASRITMCCNGPIGICPNGQISAIFNHSGEAQLYHNGTFKAATYSGGFCVANGGASMTISPHTSWNHIQGTGANFYFDKALYVNTGKIGSYDEDLCLHRAGTILACMSTSCFCSANIICAATCMKTYDICATRFIKSSNDINSGGCIIAASTLCAPIVCGTTCVRSNKLCLVEDYSGDMSNGIALGRNNGIPQAMWGASSCTTGRVEIGLPTSNGEGGSVHYGMVQVQVDVYEYDGNNTMSFLVGGHNWGRNWHNKGIHIIGGCTNKTLKLAYHECGGTCNGRYVILIGEPGSTWQYGSVHVRRVNNGTYYTGSMDMLTPMYVKQVTCADSYYMNTTSDMRPSSKSYAGYQCAITCVQSPTVCATTAVYAPTICATGTGGWTLRTAGCIYAANRIRSETDVYSNVCLHAPYVCATTRVTSPIVCATGKFCAGSAFLCNGCVHANGNVCATDIYAQSWFRNQVSGSGLYNTATSQHFYSDDDDWWNIGGGDACNGLRFRDNHATTIRGSIWANNSNQLSLSDSGGAVRVLVNTSTDIRLCNTTCVYGTLTGNGIICAASCHKAPVVCATSHGSFSGASDNNGIAIGQPYVNNGSWNSQLNMYGSAHVMARWCKASGDAADNAQFGCIWLHSSHPFTIISSGNMRLCAAGTVKLCLTSAQTCITGALNVTGNICSTGLLCTSNVICTTSGGWSLYTSGCVYAAGVVRAQSCLCTNGAIRADGHISAATYLCAESYVCAKGSGWSLYTSGCLYTVGCVRGEAGVCSNNWVHAGTNVTAAGCVCAANHICTPNHLWTGSNNNTTTVPSRFYASQDGYLRYYTRCHFKNHLGLTSKYNCSRSQITSDQNYWVGSMGWGAQSMNDAFGWGSGMIDLWSNPAGQPTSGSTHWQGVQSVHYSCSTAGTYGFQLVVGASCPASMFVRTSWGSGAGSWTKIWNAANDGAGSGLDADLLDGLQGACYYRSNNPSGYTTCTGTSTLALGSSSSTAHRGDHGVTAYNHSQAAHAPSNANYITNNSQLSNSCGYTTCTGNVVNGQACIAVTCLGSQLQSLDFTSSALGAHAGNTDYSIYRSCGAWSQPYPDLVINYHTGIRFGAYMGYQGFRFYCNSTDSTAACCCCVAGLLFSVGKGDSHVRVHCGNFYSCNWVCASNMCSTGVVNWSGGGSANANTAYTHSQAAHAPSNATACTGNVHSSAGWSWVCRQNFNANNTANWDTMATGTGSLGGIEVYNNGAGNDAFMAFHAGGDYALYFGLDADNNKLSVGGWSMGAVKYEIYHSGNKPSLATLGYTGATNANYITNNSQLSNSCGYTTCTGNIHATGFTLTGDIVSSCRSKGVFGSYNSTLTDHIWSMGTAYRNHASGTNFGNLYGLAYKHTNNSTGGNMGGGHQMVWVTNGGVRGAIGESGIWTSGYVCAANYVCAAGTSGYTLRTAGCIYANSHISSGANVYATGDICGSALVRGNQLCTPNHVYTGSNNNTTTVPSRFYASHDAYIRYYDRAHMKDHLGLTAKYNCSRSQHTTDQNYWTGAMGWSGCNLNCMFNRGSGFIDTWSTTSGTCPPVGTHFNGFQALHYSANSSYHHGMQMLMSAGNACYTYLRGWWANGGSGTGWQKIWTDCNLNNLNQLSNGPGYTTCTGTSNVAVGTGSGNAHRGDHGVTAYNHSQATHAPSNATTCTGNVVNGQSWIGASDFYSYSWFRNCASGNGMYNQVTGQHWYSDHDDWWNMGGGTTANGIRFRDEHGGTVRGAVYADNSNSVGFLDAGQSWAYKIVNDSSHYWYSNGSTTRMHLNTSGCLCVCSGARAPYICGTTCVRSQGLVCAVGGFYGSGANLTNLPSGGGWAACGGCTCSSWTSLRTSVGYCTLQCESAANSNNVVIGGNSFRKSSTGVENAVLGSNVGTYSSVFPLVSYNTFVGNRIAGYTCCNAQYNVGMGYQAMHSLSTGCYNTAVGTWAMISNTNRLTAKSNTAVGMYSLATVSNGGGCNTAIGACSGYSNNGTRNTYVGYKSGYNHTGNCTTIIGACGNTCVCLCGNTKVVGSLSKSSGCFLISHPDPAKKDRMNLSHSFVESPTEGDNIYRWQVSTENCRSVVELPGYYKHLNKNDMVWISPYKSFGVAYGEVTEDQECLIVCSNEDGCYNVLLIGTRKDEAVRDWKGVETLAINN